MFRQPEEENGKSSTGQTLRELLNSNNSYIQRITQHNEYGRTALHDAVLDIDGIDMRKIRSLLACGAHVNSRDKYGNTALHYLVKQSVIEKSKEKSAIELLFAWKAIPNPQNKAGETPLHYACESKSMIELLLSHGADLNSKDQLGRSPLEWAARSGNEETVRYLLLCGAEPILGNTDALPNNTRKLVDLYDRSTFFALFSYLEGKTDYCNMQSKALAQDICANFNLYYYEKNPQIKKLIDLLDQDSMLGDPSEKQVALGIGKLWNNVSDILSMQLQEVSNDSPITTYAKIPWIF